MKTFFFSKINSWAGHSLAPLFWLIICQQFRETDADTDMLSWGWVLMYWMCLLSQKNARYHSVPLRQGEACKWEHLANITHINLSNLCHLEKNEAVQMLLVNLTLHKDHLWCGSGCAKLKSLLTPTERIVWTSFFKKAKYMLKTRTIVL